MEYYPFSKDTMEGDDMYSVVKMYDVKRIYIYIYIYIYI